VACFSPLSAFRRVDGSVMFVERQGADTDITIPCGYCIGCRIARTREWALRCTHEAMQHDSCRFVTLTYDPAKLPAGGSLRPDDLTRFFKRVRKRLGKFRYFACGEYGDELSRPHYHVNFFGLVIPDEALLYSTRESDHPAFSSPILEQLWGFGHVHIGLFSTDTARYTASYIFKKVAGRLARQHYCRVDGDGVVHHLHPEFVRMSRSPGIGAGWLREFTGDLSGPGGVVSEGRTHPVPRFYKRKLVEFDKQLHDELAERVETESLPRRWDQTPARLSVRREVAEAGQRQKVRKYEARGDVSV